MARLQILELPSGINDDRSPYVLVIDQVPSDETKFDAIRRDLLSDGDLAPRLGARAVLVFEETIDIPANEPLPITETDDSERAGTTQIVYAHERTRLDLCNALLLSGDTTWRQLVEQAGARQRELAVLYRGRHELADTLGVARTRGWEDILNAAAGLRKQRDAQAEAIERVRRESTNPEVMDAQQEHPTVWMHGYKCGVLAAKGALRRPHNEPTVKP